VQANQAVFDWVVIHDQDSNSAVRIRRVSRMKIQGWIRRRPKSLPFLVERRFVGCIPQILDIVSAPSMFRDGV
jgi:hypothetical protein